MCATGVKWGCFIQSHPVKPGETYAVQADCLPRGASNPTVVVRWQTAESRWTHEHDDHTFVFKPREGIPAETEQRSAVQAGEWQTPKRRRQSRFVEFAIKPAFPRCYH